MPSPINILDSRNTTGNAVPTAASAVQRSEKGVVALILKDAKENGGHAYTNVTQVPSTLGAANQAYVQQAFLGYVNPPRKVLVYVLPAEAEALTDALNWLATQVFDYLAGPPDCSETEATAIATWIASRRTNDAAICKAVLPNQAADSEAIVNFTTDDILVGSSKYTSAQYCARIAGLIAGTPMTISCTYAPLAEVSCTSPGTSPRHSAFTGTTYRPERMVMMDSWRYLA